MNQVSFEIESFNRHLVRVDARVDNESSRIEVTENTRAQIERFSICNTFAVFAAFDQNIAIQGTRIRLALVPRTVVSTRRRRASYAVAQTCPRLSHARMELPSTSWSFQRAPASMLDW